MPIGLCVLDRSLRIMRINESLAGIDGIHADEYLGKTLREVIPFDFSGKIESLARSVVDKGEPLYDIELSESPAPVAGRARSWMAHILPIKADDGQVQAVSIAVEETTKRKLAEDERVRLTAILESTSDLIATTRPDGEVAYMNAAGRRMLGLDDDEDIRGYRIHDAHPEWAFRTVTDEGVPAALRHGIWEGETAVLSRDGREIPVSQVIMTHRSESGEVESISTIMRDISQQKQTEERLRENEANLREAQEIARMGRWDLDLVAGRLVWSDGIFDLFGVSRESFAASYEAFLEMVHPDDRAMVDNAYRTSVESGTPYEIEHRLLMKDGRIKWVSEIGRTEYDETGRPARSFGTVQDITERKLIEEALRISEHKYRKLHESIRDAFVSTDMEGNVKDYNRYYLSMLGYAPEEISSLTYRDVTPEKWHEMEESIVQTQVLRRGYSDVYEKEYRKKDGTVFPVDLRTVLIRDEAGNPAGMWATVRDITERKRMEENLRSSEARFRSYFEQHAFGLTVTSLEKGWIEANDRLCEILGYSRDELMHMTWAELTHPDDLETDVVQFNRVLSGEIDGYSMEKRYIRKDGQPIWTSISVRCSRLADGKPDYFIGIVQDITERKKAEEELDRYRQSLEDLVGIRTIELEEKNKELREEIAERERAEGEKRKIELQLAQAQRIEALDRFAGGIAHDLNNILYPVIINLEELLDMEPHVSSRRDILEQTLKAAHRQGDLVKKILSFSRKSERVVQPVHLRPLLAETVSFLKSTLPSTVSIQQHFSVRADAVMGDPVQLQQVIMNLCKNAADAYGPHQGTIVVGLAKTRITSLHGHQDLREGDYLVLTVKDTGIGMKPEVVDRIFEPFFTTKDVGKGTGMGLSVVHGIVRSHGGAVTVESEQGKGSLFTVYLPVCGTEHRAQAPPAGSTAEVQAKESILLVDDEEIVLSSLTRSLRQSGYRVASFQDGLAALQRFNEEPHEFDLVITDLTMPGITGLELSRKILTVRPDTPVVLCTGYNDIISQDEARSLGIRELLIKPAGTRELKNTISRALRDKLS